LLVKRTVIAIDDGSVKKFKGGHSMEKNGRHDGGRCGVCWEVKEGAKKNRYSLSSPRGGALETGVLVWVLLDVGDFGFPRWECFGRLHPGGIV